MICGKDAGGEEVDGEVGPGVFVVFRAFREVDVLPEIGGVDAGVLDL